MTKQFSDFVKSGDAPPNDFKFTVKRYGKQSNLGWRFSRVDDLKVIMEGFAIWKKIIQCDDSL